MKALPASARALSKITLVAASGLLLGACATSAQSTSYRADCYDDYVGSEKGSYTASYPTTVVREPAYATPVANDRTPVTVDDDGNAWVSVDEFESYSYNAFYPDGRLAYEIDERGLVTRHDYDELGDRVGILRFANPLDLEGWQGEAPLSVEEVENRLIFDPENDRSLVLVRQDDVAEPVRQPAVRPVQVVQRSSCDRERYAGWGYGSYYGHRRHSGYRTGYFGGHYGWPGYGYSYNHGHGHSYVYGYGSGHGHGHGGGHHGQPGGHPGGPGPGDPPGSPPPDGPDYQATRPPPATPPVTVRDRFQRYQQPEPAGVDREGRWSNRDENDDVGVVPPREAAPQALRRDAQQDGSDARNDSSPRPDREDRATQRERAPVERERRGRRSEDRADRRPPPA